MKAFSVQHVNKTRSKLQKAAQLAYTVQSDIKKDKSIQEHPLISFIGPQNVGKTTLVESVIYNLSHKKIKQQNNVITLHIPNCTQQYISFYDCSNSIESVIDISRLSSHIVLVIDINKGLELEHFEYLCALQSLNWPLITVVLTHCDEANNFIKQRKQIKERLEKEIASGIKLYIANYDQKTGMYDSTNMSLLSRHLTIKCGSWNNFIKQNPAIMISNIIKQGKKYILQGFVHGNSLNKNDYFIIPGVNYQQFQLQEFQIEKNPLEQQDKILSNKTEIYAPMCQIDDLVVNRQWIQVQQNKQEEQPVKKFNFDEEDDMQLFVGDQIMKGEDLLYQGEEQSEQDVPQQEYVEQSYPSQEESLDSGSTDTNLDNFDLDNLLQQNEEVEEMDESENKLEKLKQQNQSEKVQVTPNPQSILQLQQQIYKYYRQRNIQKQQQNQQSKTNNLLKLFDDDQSPQNTLYLNAIDPKTNIIYENSNFLQFMPKDMNLQVTDKNSFFYFNFNQNLQQQDVKHLFINDEYDYIDQINQQIDQYINHIIGVDIQNQNSQQNSQDQKEVNNFMKQFQISNQFLEIQQKKIQEQNELENLFQTQNENLIPQGSFITCEIDQNCLEVKNVSFPLILAKSNRNSKTYNTFKLRHHRWYPLPLKSGNPAFIIAGWFRFQSPVTYGVEIENQENQDSLRIRYLKYTPNSMHCFGTCFGPQLQSGTRIILINKFEEKGWRIAANGILHSTNPTSNVYKKLKLIGTVSDIWKNTVYSENLFTSVLEGREFIGCGVETISKIRGIIKGVQGTQQGYDEQKKQGQQQDKKTKCVTRITFEDKIRRNDLIILKTQVKYKIEQLCIDYINYSNVKQQYIRMAYEIRQQDNKPLLIKSDTRFLSEQEEQNYEHVTFQDRELQLNQKEIKALPFEEQVKYINKLQQIKQERESTNMLTKPKKLKNKVLNNLLQSDTDKQQKLIAEMKALDQYVQKDKEQKKAQQQNAKEKWEQGMNKKKDEEKKQKIKDKQKRKRFLLEKVAQKELKKKQI